MKEELCIWKSFVRDCVRHLISLAYSVPTNLNCFKWGADCGWEWLPVKTLSLPKPHSVDSTSSLFNTIWWCIHIGYTLFIYRL